MPFQWNSGMQRWLLLMTALTVMTMRFSNDIDLRTMTKTIIEENTHKRHLIGSNKFWRSIFTTFTSFLHEKNSMSLAIVVVFVVFLVCFWEIIPVCEWCRWRRKLQNYTIYVILFKSSLYNISFTEILSLDNGFRLQDGVLLKSTKNYVKS